ncbi:uncharacterized protein LOC142586962 [Dermacentor variabilis]|uniref:uncharacterized protein LOC142586962 n=1 Tax=Dermacentor variabilis TaxID=34621 RepID=UPI003F5BB61A
MHSVASFVVVFSVVIIAATATNETDCVFTDLDLDGALRTVITQLSKQEEYESMKNIGSYSDILEVECCSLRGLQRLRQYGPLLPYCVNGTRKFQVDLVHDGPIEMIMNWWWHGESGGTLTLGTLLSRFTLQFAVFEQPPGKTIALRLENPPVPVATEVTYVSVEGAGEAIRAVVAFWNKLLPSVTQRVWNKYFFGQLRNAIDDVQLGLFDSHEESISQEDSLTEYLEHTEFQA